MNVRVKPLFFCAFTSEHQMKFFSKLSRRGAARTTDGITQKILEMAGCGAVFF